MPIRDSIVICHGSNSFYSNLKSAFGVQLICILHSCLSVNSFVSGAFPPQKSARDSPQHMGLMLCMHTVFYLKRNNLSFRASTIFITFISQHQLY